MNIGANVVSPSNDFSNLYPRLISFRTGGLITGFLGLAMCPWKLLATPDAYIFGWLVGYSGLLGPVAGIMVADYFFIRKTELDRELALSPRRHLPLHQGRQSARHRRAGARRRPSPSSASSYQPLHFLYDYAWFVGFFTAGIVYVALMRLAAPAAVPERAEEVA